jgi:hypothetical protein
MSRSGYSDDIEDNWSWICWRGAVASAIRGKRGQAALREIAAALDAMPEKTLAAESLQTADGEFCTLGALGKARGMELEKIDPDDWHQVAKEFGISSTLAREIMYENDETVSDRMVPIRVEVCGPLRPWEPRFKRVAQWDPSAGARRWQYMRDWVESSIKKESA